MTNKESFVKAFESIIEDSNCGFVAVDVQAPNCEGIETIVNPRINFKTKLEYYKNAYDDDMCLKSFPEIKITGIYEM